MSVAVVVSTGSCGLCGYDFWGCDYSFIPGVKAGVSKTALTSPVVWALGKQRELSLVISGSRRLQGSASCCWPVFICMDRKTGCNCREDDCSQVLQLLIATFSRVFATSEWAEGSPSNKTKVPSTHLKEQRSGFRTTL